MVAFSRGLIILGYHVTEALRLSTPPPLRPGPDHEGRRGRRHGGSLPPPLLIAPDHTTETLEGAGVDTNGLFPPPPTVIPKKTRHWKSEKFVGF